MVRPSSEDGADVDLKGGWLRTVTLWEVARER